MINSNVFVRSVIYKFPFGLSACAFSSSSLTHFHVVLIQLFLYGTFSLSPCNKAEIPSSVRRDLRGKSAQRGVEALSFWLPQCVQPCRTQHRLAAGNRKAVGESSSASRPTSVAALSDWQMGTDALAFPCVLF